MLWIGHIIVTRLYFGTWTWWSIAPDLPKKYRKVYAFHVLCDILSHTGKWSIEPLYPLDLTIHGIWDPVDWA